VVAAVCQRAVVMYAGQVVEVATVDDLYAQPLHPYTRGLLMSNPHGVLPSDKLPTIPGTVPAPGEWPSGCRFHPRCPQAHEDCALTPVALREFGERRSRCLYAEDLITSNDG
jgi:peptide/nickel transport system permease protein